MMFDAISKCELVCPSCVHGRVEREIAVPDPIRGGELVARDEVCDMCGGSGYADPSDYSPWNECMHSSERLLSKLEVVCDVSADNDQTKWDQAIKDAEVAFETLRQNMFTLKEWKST